MSEFQLAVLAYLPLQAASLILLPRWWKAAALPGLLAALGIFDRGGYMGDLLATLALIIACIYLLLPWSAFGIVRLSRRAADPASAGASSARRLAPVALLSPVFVGALIALLVFARVSIFAAFLVALPAVFALVAGSLALGGKEPIGRATLLGLLVAVLAAVIGCGPLFLMASRGWAGAR